MDEFEGKKITDKILWNPVHEFSGKYRDDDKDMGKELWKLGPESRMESGAFEEEGALEGDMAAKSAVFDSHEEAVVFDMIEEGILPGIENVSVHAMGL